MTAFRRLLCTTVALAALAPSASASAAGPPVPNSASGRAGAVAPGGVERLVTRRAGENTRVAALRREDGAVLRSSVIPGRWQVAPVTFDNGTTGLSADGRTLVLARPTRAYPPPSTHLAVVDAFSLRLKRRIALQRFYTVDAVSPDGRLAYLILFGKSVLDYRVRALDTSTGAFVPGDVVDPRSPDEQMGGLPYTRAVSPDGRWFYTLYGGGEETFIHALDTVGRTAACIDLDMLAPTSDLSAVRLRLHARAGALDVRDGGRLVATVDTRTFRASEPRAAVAAPRRTTPAPADGGGGFPLTATLAVAAGALLVAVSLLGARARLGRTAGA